ncbi:hypothetical protein [Clostridium arbusti]|uniref:hypothetical protein n=1 Tax=Clostridium arbusti TaxID=1137848 RepID=UPI000289FF79|nr:hypothetical protein [Clostridium arbusti]
MEINAEMEKVNYTYEEVLQEVRKDIDIISEKEENIEGYFIIKQLIDLVPSKYKEYIRVEGNDLYFSWERLGKITNISDIQDESPIDDELYPGNRFDKVIWINRQHGGTIDITFKFGKMDDGHWGHIDYQISPV